MSDLRSRIYEGFVTHARTRPVKHGFSFPIYSFALDLDELEKLDKEIRFFGYNRGSVFSTTVSMIMTRLFTILLRFTILLAKDISIF